MTLAQSAPTASLIASVSERAFGPRGLVRTARSAFRVRGLRDSQPDAEAETPETPAPGSRAAPVDPGFSDDSRLLVERVIDAERRPQAATIDPSIGLAIAEHARADIHATDPSMRLRWPIRDGFSTLLGAGLTSAAAFAVMGICAVAAAEFAPVKGTPSFERAAAQAAGSQPYAAVRPLR